MASISRSEVIHRAATMWPAGTVPYSQDTIHPGTGYRQDCSGFVSMCWAISPNASPGGWGGLNTVTLVTGGYMSEINPADLKPGDAVGICGPNTGGDDGHIVIFERWYNDDPADDRYWCFEQMGGTKGPTHRVITYPYPSSGPWKSYRFRDITDTSDGQEITMADDYGPYGKPVSVGDRTTAVMIADLWSQNLKETSPYVEKSPSTVSARLQRVEKKLDDLLKVLQAQQGK